MKIVQVRAGWGALILLGGCTFFGTSHQNFIETMNQIVAGDVIGAQQDNRGKFVTIDLVSDPSRLPGIGEKRDLVKIEHITESKERLHYKRSTLWKDRFCYYYIDIERESRRLISWGFDYEKGNPKENCGISG